MSAHALVKGGQRERMFYVGMTVVVAAIVFVGFARTESVATLMACPRLGQ